MLTKLLLCHPRESGDPDKKPITNFKNWIPAYAGMTTNSFSRFITHFIALISFTLLLTACVPKAPDITVPAHMPPDVIPQQQPRVALVLGGGGMRGAAHLGVIKVLEENHIPIDLIVGTSSGSIVGVLYADDPNADELNERFMKLKRSDMIDASVFSQEGGFDNGYTLQKFILKNVQAKEFDQLKIKLVVVATDLSNGNAVALSSGPIAPAINASSAIPPVFRPVKLYGYTLADGGASEVVPVEIAERYHPKVIIAVDVERTPPTDITGKTMFDIAGRYSILRAKNYSLYQAEQADILIQPQVGMTGTFDFSARPAMILAGEQATAAELPAIKKLLREKGIM